MPVPAHTALLGAHEAAAPAGWDASDWGTVYAEYDFSDTGTITLSGSAVTAVTDKSGNGRTISQGTGANRPDSGLVTLNSLNVLSYGIADRLVSASLTVAQPVTVAYVFESNETASASSGSSLSLNGGNFDVFHRDSDTLWRGRSNTEVAMAAQALDLDPHILVVCFNGASSFWAFDGASRTTVNFGTGGLSSGTLVVGGNGTTFGMNGTIGHVVYYSQAVADEVGLADALNTKWAIY
jgi:hypothetical protein